jgi:1,4-dihydroxy-2-naphthoate octaprenyltransferase
MTSIRSVEFPDYHAGRGANKRTLVVRLGRERASQVFATLVAAIYVVLALLPFAGVPSTVLLGVGLVPAAMAARRLVADPDCTARVIPAQQLTLLSFVLVAAGMGIGLLLGAM